MARKVEIQYTCDAAGESEHRGPAVPVPFALAGTAYEIDLCGPHRADLAGVFAGFIAAARPVAARRAKRDSRDRARSAAIREWARRQDDPALAVGDRGRLPVPVLARYQQAHQ